MKDYILECCVDSMPSALNAVHAGATRLELCSNLIIGGTTPDLSLFRQITSDSRIDVHVLIRPRFGDFCYDRFEKKCILDSIDTFCDAGATAIVIGALTPEGYLDLPFMKEMIKHAHGKKITLHRAFDVAADPWRAVEESIDLGVNTILTSGQKTSAWEGRVLLDELTKKFHNQIDVMAGAGINAATIEKLVAATGITSYHMSGKVVIDSPMIYRKKDVSMGLDSFSEYEIWRTSEYEVRKAVKVLQTL